MTDHTNLLPIAGSQTAPEPGDCGRGHACSFCPENEGCRLSQADHDRHLIERRLEGIAAVVAVMANKGGVGKSTVAANLAVALARQGLRVGLADADVHGPNAPRLFGLQHERVKVARKGIAAPTYRTKDGCAEVQVGSLGFFLPESDTPIVWRDPYKFDYIHHLVGSYDWGPLDVLLIDMPPGTGNELITLCDLLEGRPLSALLVSPADAVALQDTLKAARFCRERGVPILGLVENFAGLICPHCEGEIELFPRDPAIKLFEAEGIETLGRMPFAPSVSAAVSAGHPIVGLDCDDSAANPFLRLAEACIARSSTDLADPMEAESR